MQSGFKWLLIARFNFKFLAQKWSVDDCSVQISISLFPRINWWLQHSFLLFQRIDSWLQHSLFIFLVLKAVDDCNIQFSIFRFLRNNWLQHSILQCEARTVLALHLTFCQKMWRLVIFNVLNSPLGSWTKVHTPKWLHTTTGDWLTVK